MGRHTELEHLQVAREIVRIEPAAAQRDFELRTLVQPLAAGGDLEAAVQQVETLRGTACASRRRVERPIREREAENEHGGDPVLGLRQGTQAPLGLGVEIVAQMLRAVRMA